MSDSAPGLTVVLESSLPDSLPVGTATAIFCAGVCWHRDEDVTALAIDAGGSRQAAAAVGMPRPDAPRYRSGFWSTVRLPAQPAPGRLDIRAAVRLASGAEVVATLGAVEIVERLAPPPCPDVPACRRGDLIAVCMATFEPDDALLRTQLESLRAQTEEGWICLISDDCSSPEAFERVADAVGDDPRFVLSRSPERLGFYRNFERALEMAPAEAALVALCDQDDRWYPDKLAVLRAALGEAQLVYSDQRLVDPDGRVLRETLWRGRRNNHTNLASMLAANTITGAASLMRREVAERALPFPDTPGLQFHDHWLGVLALTAGDVAYVDRPLYDYVQHAGAVLGHVEERARDRGRLRTVLRPGGGTFDRWRKRYFLGYLAREVQAQAALARCDDRLTARKRRAITLFLRSQRSVLALAWLAARSPLRDLVGRDETLGTELELAQGILWRRLVGLRARVPWPRGSVADARYPDPMSWDDMGFEQRRLRRWRASA